MCFLIPKIVRITFDGFFRSLQCDAAIPVVASRVSMRQAIGAAARVLGGLGKLDIISG